MITQNVTLSNALECKIQKRSKILILAGLTLIGLSRGTEPRSLCPRMAKLLSSLRDLIPNFLKTFPLNTNYIL